MRIAFVQHGDYRDAVHRFERGERETYGSQRYTVDAVAKLVERTEAITVICLQAEAVHDRQRLSNGVHSIGLDLRKAHGVRDVTAALASLDLTHLILRTPSRALLRWSKRRRIPTLALLADSFRISGVRSRIRYRLLARLLNRPLVEWVGNHGVNASRSLERIGVDPLKILPWDYPQEITPDDYPPKQRDVSPRGIRVFYAGVISEAKGVTDAIDAVKRVNERGQRALLTIAGNDRNNHMHRYVETRNARNFVRFIGRIPRSDVVSQMHVHDAVVVPSRHAYPEGFPLTIYEAYCARTPLIASDHPMFMGKVVHGDSGLVFRERNVEELADCIQRLASDDDLCAALSENSKKAWEALQIPVKWHELVERFLEGTENHRAWVEAHCLASGQYD